MEDWIWFQVINTGQSLSQLNYSQSIEVWTPI